MKYFIACVAVALVAVVHCQTEPPPEDPPCEDGYCCNQFCLKRNDTILPSIRWDCEIHTANLTQCKVDYPECNAFDYDPENEPTGCALPGTANNCLAMSQCCWDKFWENTKLGDVKPGASGLRNKWGDYFCEQAKRDASSPGLYWTLLFQGRANHCGRLNPTWARMNDNPNQPLLCCNNLGNWDEDCANAET